MAWPMAREFTFKAFGQNAPSYSGKVKSVRLLGGTAVPFTQSPEGLSVTLPEQHPNEISAVLAITFEASI